MNAATLFSILFSVLVPQKMWYAPGQPITVTVAADKDVTLELTDFAGKPIESSGSADVSAHQAADIQKLYPRIANPGAYVLYALNKGTALSQDGAPKDFLGTPIVIEVETDTRGQVATKPMIIHVVPMQYAVLNTDAGKMTSIFYYDSAPHTADSFLKLASEGFYDGLSFHRIVPGFVIQGGDPVGDGTGGPAFHVDAEFNDRPHSVGVLSMARNGDPNEASGAMPSAPYANSAGSQFFICLDYTNTKQLDGRYTAFGKVVDGVDVAQKIGQSKIADPQSGRPEVPTVIQHVDVLPVTADNNPYQAAASTEPASTAPAN
jgi:cyclophilin family peptidyl-prolyl cis-trans isomerase